MQNSVGKCLYQRQKPSCLNLILNIIIILFFLLFVGELIFNSFFTNIYVKGSSMMPTLTGAPSTGTNEVLEGGDYVFVNTRATPGYSDIVVVKTRDEHGASYDIIKRVIAFGGDTVKIDRGQLWIKYKGKDDYERISEPYVSAEFNDPYKYINNYGEHVVEEGCMFLLGDNRNVSNDSRENGDYPMSALVGVVPQWALNHKATITSIYTFFEFKLGFINIGGRTSVG